MPDMLHGPFCYVFLNTLRPILNGRHFADEMTFSSALSWMKMFEFQSKFHLSLFPRAQSTIFQHWFIMFIWWLGAVQATSHYLNQLHQPRLWFITGGYLVKRWFIPAAARARGQSNDLNREILASNLFNCHKEVINTPPVPSISRCIHIVYRHKNVWEYQRSNFIYNCMSTFLHYVHCKDALLDCSAPGGERCESLTWVDEIMIVYRRIYASLGLKELKEIACILKIFLCPFIYLFGPVNIISRFMRIQFTYKLG